MRYKEQNQAQGWQRFSFILDQDLGTLWKTTGNESKDGSKASSFSAITVIMNEVTKAYLIVFVFSYIVIW